MAYPNLPGKHALDALFAPADLLAYSRAQGTIADLPPPRGVLLCYQPALARTLLGEGAAPRPRLPGHARLLPGDLAVASGFGVGAPVAAIILEELVAWGVRRVLSVGTAGALAPGLGIGDVVLCTSAIRDEGTSHHYLPPEHLAEPSPELSARLGVALRARGLQVTEGRSWTTDAPYRETVAEVRRYRDEGVLTVEMEAAALFAVARHRGVEVACALVISDTLSEVWEPHFASEGTRAGLEAAAAAALEVLATGGKQGGGPPPVGA
jgi:uridine phosphorylase